MKKDRLADMQSLLEGTACTLHLDMLNEPLWKGPRAAVRLLCYHPVGSISQTESLPM